VSSDFSRIILVEDDSSVARLLSHHLQKAGWAVTIAATLAEARMVLQEAPWDLMVLDRRLPDGDGIELCREVRKDAAHGYILMLTGEGSEEAKLEGFGCGADDYVTKPFQIPELLARIRAGLRIAGLQRRLMDLSTTDVLTGVGNRRAFDQALIARFEQARRYGSEFSLVLIDVDHFKNINDTRGHPAGDEVLRLVGGVLRERTRSSDLVARYGGVEFAILLPQTALFETLRFAEKIRAAVAAQVPGVTISIGIASLSQILQATPAAMLDAADRSLYRAKAAGRNRVDVGVRGPRFGVPLGEPLNVR
jgi:diguanylate cyclase (GGDEF)-like protein